MDYETGRYLYDRRVQDDPKQYRLYNYKDYSNISTRPKLFESKTVVPWSTWSSEGPLKVRLSHPPSGAFVQPLPLSTKGRAQCRRSVSTRPLPYPRTTSGRRLLIGYCFSTCLKQQLILFRYPTLGGLSRSRQIFPQRYSVVLAGSRLFSQNCGRSTKKRIAYYRDPNNP